MATPVKQGLFGPMKTAQTAKTERRELPMRRISISIQHEPMPGVTAKMLRWWFENIDSTTTLTENGFTGPSRLAYLLWHPHDHISASWKKKVKATDGRIGPGSMLRAEERLGGKHLSRNNVQVTRFDDGAFNFQLGEGRAQFGEVRHLYSDSPQGLSLRTEMDFGVQWPLLWRVFNPMLRSKALTPELIDAWIVHNVEECGETEKFLPRLYEHSKNK